MTVVTAALSDGLRVRQSAQSSRATYASLLTSTLAVRSAQAAKLTYHSAIYQHLALKGGGLFFYNAAAHIAERAVFSQASSQHWIKRVAIKDRMAMSSLTKTQGIYHAVAPLQRMKIRASQRVARLMSIHDGVKISTAVTIARASILRDHLSIAMRVATEWHYSALLKDAVRIRSRLRSAAGAALHDYLAVASKLQPVYHAVARMSDDLLLAGNLSPLLQICVLETETFQLTDDNVVEVIYRGLLVDGLDFFLDLLDPSASMTTWATNARTGATTEYTDYDFNSFAGDLAAGSDGLYELLGDTDDGQPVVADVISGLGEFAGNHFTMFQAAYIAMRGQGQFYLKLTTGDGKSYVYSVNGKNLRTQRINLGKGLRARYFTWELVSTGQDFDLLGLDFLPVASTRRV